MEMRKKLLDNADLALRVLTLFLVVVFVLYPFIAVFLKALLKEGSLGLGQFSFLKEELFLLSNSIKSGLLTASISTTFALSLSLQSFFLGPRSRRVLMFILLLTMVSPPFIGSLTYIQLFGRSGLITKKLLGLSINPYGIWGIVSVQTLGFTSASAMLLITYLDQFDRTMLEAAKSLGASTTAILLDIVLPLIRPAIFVSFLLSFIRSMADFTSPMIIGGAFNTLATEAYLSIIAKGNSPRASALSIVLFIPSMVVFFIYSYFYKQQKKASKSTRAVEVRMKKSGLFYIIGFLSLFFVAWLLIQYGAVISSAFTDKYRGQVYFTLDNIRDSIPHIRDAFLRSIVYSLIGALASSLLALFISYYAFIRGMGYMKLVDFIASMPYIVPGTFFGLGYIFAFNKVPLKLTGTALIVILNLVFRQLPMSTRTLATSLGQIEKETLDSARDLGAHNLYILKDVVFPLAAPGLFLSFTSAFISSMTTVGSIIFLVYPSRKLATLVLFDLVNSGKYKVAAVLSCFIMIICLGVSLLSYRVYNRRGHVSRS